MINDILRDKLNIIAGDELLLLAIKEVFNERIEREKPKVGDTNDNSLLGEKYRAYEEAKYIIEMAFLDIATFKTSSKLSKIFSKER